MTEPETTVDTPITRVEVAMYPDDGVRHWAPATLLPSAWDDRRTAQLDDGSTLYGVHPDDVRPAPAPAPVAGDLREQMWEAMRQNDEAHWGIGEPGVRAFTEVALSVVRPLLDAKDAEIAQLRSDLAARTENLHCEVEGWKDINAALAAQEAVAKRERDEIRATLESRLNDACATVERLAWERDEARRERNLARRDDRDVRQMHRRLRNQVSKRIGDDAATLIAEAHEQAERRQSAENMRARWERRARRLRTERDEARTEVARLADALRELHVTEQAQPEARQPRVWPRAAAEPDDRPRFRDAEGNTWVWHTERGGWTFPEFYDRPSVAVSRWESILADYGPLTEVLPEQTQQDGDNRG